jgi:hypothetical protein
LYNGADGAADINVVVSIRPKKGHAGILPKSQRR